MTKEQQDLLWACLPKDERDGIKLSYRYYSQKIADKNDPEYIICGYLGAQVELELSFGCHNLTSDTEPDEMLTVERKKVKEIYLENMEPINASREPRDCIDPDCVYAKGVIYALKALFGDKCLPDKEQ